MPPISNETVRRRFIMLLASSGVTSGQTNESIMIRDGVYCGKRMTLESYSLVWFAEENQIKVFRPDGSLWISTSVENFLMPEQVRRAA